MAALVHEGVKYWLFPNLSSSRDELTRKHLLERYLDEYLANLGPFLINYIWQKEPFQLKVVNNDSTEMPAHLEGSTKFGDNIEDEWFIVFLLVQLTKEDEHLVIKVKDNDGEFLLIEAADYLPKWLNPDTSESRIYLYRENLHIVNIAQFPVEITPNISDAIRTVVSRTGATKASQSIQQAIRHRINGYPEKIETFQHRTHCYVPAAVAAILKHDPALIAAAVQAFYFRDPIDLKACRVMKYFPPETRVMTEVTFTRCLYAQLMQQQYVPDKRVGWNMPLPHSPEFKSYDLGMKLACGFEILIAGMKKSSDGNTLPEDIDFAADNRWKRYLQTLKDKGYFKGELEGSILYQKLLKEAKYFYCENVRKLSNEYAPAVKILQLLEMLSINYEELKEAEKDLKPPDDDSWLELTPQDLDTILTEHAEKAVKKSNCTNTKEERLAGTITESLKSFVHHKSDYEGVEFSKFKRNQKSINFDANHFTDAMHSILDFHVPDSDDDSSSEMSGYSDEDDGMDLLNKEDCRKKTEELMEGMKEYMEQMDRELFNSDVGLSFEHLPQRESQDDVPNNEMEKEQKAETVTSSEEKLDKFSPIDVDLTALKNILESYNCQQGLPGPAGNLLSSMGVHIPENEDSK